MAEQELRRFRSRLNQLPLDLKVEIGEIAYQKGMRPTSRRDKIIELFDKYNVKVKNVGTGTNRHIVKYDQYVIKIALDKEGIADNKQEWVMSGHLAPDVAEALEISSGGHLLVSEYCPAFSTFFEMSTHRPEIEKILTKWSSKYLIGDIGIVGKNYANWGINTSGKPVCIDYAYVFPVGLNIFTCTCGKCSMTMDSTFSKYKCIFCKTEYNDAELRMSISQNERIRMFSNVSGIRMTEAIEEHLASKKLVDKKNIPEYPTVYDSAEYFLEMVGGI